VTTTDGGEPFIVVHAGKPFLLIVGAGPASSVLANRLSADGDSEVLVLAAGNPDEKREIGLPAALSAL